MGFLQFHDHESPITIYDRARTFLQAVVHGLSSISWPLWYSVVIGRYNMSWHFGSKYVIQVWLLALFFSVFIFGSRVRVSKLSKCIKPICLEKGNFIKLIMFSAGNIKSTPVKCFRAIETVAAIVEMLKSTTHNGFPVVNQVCWLFANYLLIVSPKSSVHTHFPLSNPTVASGANAYAGAHIRAPRKGATVVSRWKSLKMIWCFKLNKLIFIVHMDNIHPVPGDDDEC